jgi:hypothetical protein
MAFGKALAAWSANQRTARLSKKLPEETALFYSLFRVLGSASRLHNNGLTDCNKQRRQRNRQTERLRKLSH